MKFFREWTSNHKFRAGRMISRSGLERLMGLSNTGYASNYYFNEHDAETIKQNKSIKGFKKAEVGADFCLIDIDKPDELTNVEAALKDLGVRYKVYSTGGKGYHVVVPHQWVYGANVPYSHLHFTNNLGLDVDPTSFQPQRIVSLPGCVHRTTKRKKELIKVVDGVELELEIVDPPERKFPTVDITPDDSLSAVFLTLSELCDADIRPGSRHTTLWGLGKDMARAGVDVRVATYLAELVNGTWTEPKDEGVRSAIEQGFESAWE